MAGLLIAPLFLFSAALPADTLPLTGSGSWSCGFYPSSTGYGSDTMFSFTAQDVQGNLISGNLSFGNAHVSPVCIPGFQPYQGIDGLAEVSTTPVYGNYSYFGQNYGAGGDVGAAECDPGCYISLAFSQDGDISLTLGFLSSPHVESYLDLAGFASITSSTFGQQEINGYPYYFSDGSFTISPEPAAWSLLAAGAFLLLAGAGIRRLVPGWQ